MKNQQDGQMNAVFSKVQKILVQLNKYREKQNQFFERQPELSHKNLHQTKVLSLSILPSPIKTTQTIGCQTVRKVQLILPLKNNNQNGKNEIKNKIARTKTQLHCYHNQKVLIKSVAYLKQINLNSRILNQETIRHSRSRSKGLSLTSSRSQSKQKSKQMIKLIKKRKVDTTR